MLNAILLPFALMLGAWLLWFIFVPPKGAADLPPHERALATRLRWLGVLTLAAGLLAAGYVDWKMKSIPEQDDDVVGYEVGAGYSAPIKASDSKRSDAQLERIGGKGAVAIAEFRTWFGRQWRGRNLASTLAVLSVGGFLGFFFLARHLTRPEHAPAGPATSPAAVSPPAAPPA